MGMAAALAAFFGCPLGGSLFALEVCSRFGIEYFEHLIESIFCGEISLVVFRSLCGLPIKPIWDLTGEGGRLLEIEPWLVVVGGLIGLIGAFMACIFATFHWKVMALFSSLNLLDNSRAVYRALFGGIFIVLVGVLVPHTLFWGEAEFEIVANMGPAKDLPNVWPKTGLSGFEMDSPWNAFVLGMCKMIAISFTVAAGLRGGYIFPLMCTGAAFGRVFDHFTPDAIPMQISVLCMAAGMNVAITRTSLASTLILAFLPGEPCAIPPILMASICSLFATAYVVRFGYFPRIFLCYVALDLLFCLFCSRSLRVKLRGVTLITVFFTKSISSRLGRPCRMMKTKFLVIQ
jgi:H+/Cl- antiporter ClcA